MEYLWLNYEQILLVGYMYIEYIYLNPMAMLKYDD